MKSFSQFLQESYIEEEQADQLRILKRDNKTAYDLRKPIGNRGIATDPTPLPANRRLSPSAPEAPKEAPGQQVIRQTSNPPTTKALEPGKTGGELGKPTGAFPDAMGQGAYDAARRQSSTSNSKSSPGVKKTNPRATTGVKPPRPTPASRRLSSAAPEGSKEVPGQQVIRQSPTPASRPALEPGKTGGELGKPTGAFPDAMGQGAYDAANKPTTTAKPSSTKTSTTPKPRTTAYRNVGMGKETVKVPASQPSTTGSSRKDFTPEVEAEIRRQRAARREARAAAYDAKTNKSSSALAKRQSSSLTTTGKPSSSAIVPAEKLPTGAKPSSKWAKIGKFAGPASAALDTVTSTADERAKGSGWARSLAKGATVAAGGLAGGALGALGGGGLGSAALGTAGAIGGAQLAGRAFDTAAGANAKERAAMAKANRQRQAGTAIKGIGGQTTFSQKKPGGPAFMSTGSGSQRKTVQLAKTGVVQRGSQSTAGHLAFKGGKAVYKAGPSAQSLAKTSSNPLERIGRSLFAGAYKKHDAAKAQQALQKARQNDAARNKKLGVKALPGK